MMPSAGTCTILALAACWIVWYILVLQPASVSNKPWGPRWLAVSVSGALHSFGCWYLNFSHNVPEHIKAGHWEEGKQYVFSWHPHGAFTISALYFVSHWWAKDMPGGIRGKQFVCVAPLLLRIPFLAEFLLLCHARSQDRKTFNKLLGEGATVAVQPGGLIEQVETDDQQERLFFPANLGFIRLAIKHGVPLCPVYAFGENQLYRTTGWVRRLNTFFYKYFKSGNLVVLGQGGIPVTPALPNPLLLPIFRNKLHIHLGKPVEVGPKEENPSDERVQEVFKNYAASLQEMFDENKYKYLPKEVADRGLEINVRSKN
eukprot:gb/GFBE01028268.1/.p1 GENE.gb/GFBE01028268.1/~~gb/GFBE01028268.1/.p1  ORF type:complete len:315 (+),score=62.07 gb/GFBE01028268.1/:1-945(+)